MYTMHEAILTATIASLPTNLSHTFMGIHFGSPLRLTWPVYVALSYLLEPGWLSNRYTMKDSSSPTSPRNYQ